MTVAMGGRTEIDRVVAMLRIALDHGIDPVLEVQFGGIRNCGNLDSLFFKAAVERDLRTFRHVVETGESFAGTENERAVVTAYELFNRRFLTAHGCGNEALYAFFEVGDNGSDVRYSTDHRIRDRCRPHR